jgi:hypothetical protein
MDWPGERPCSHYPKSLCCSHEKFLSSLVLWKWLHITFYHRQSKFFKRLPQTFNFWKLQLMRLYRHKCYSENWGFRTQKCLLEAVDWTNLQWPWQIHYIDYNDDLPQVYSSAVPNNKFFMSHAALLSFLQNKRKRNLSNLKEILSLAESRV